jgi:hypothetical protein
VQNYKFTGTAVPVHFHADPASSYTNKNGGHLRKTSERSEKNLSRQNSLKKVRGCEEKYNLEEGVTQCLAK